MFITDIPSDVLFSVFNDWISAKEFCFLDSAMCNNITSREQLSSVFTIKSVANHRLPFGSGPCNQVVALRLLSEHAKFTTVEIVFKILAKRQAYHSDLFQFMNMYCKVGFLDKVNCLDFKTSVSQLRNKVQVDKSDINGMKFLMWASNMDTCLLVVQKLNVPTTREVYVSGTIKQKSFVIDIDKINVISKYYFGIDRTFLFSGSVNEQMMFHGKGSRIMQSPTMLQGQPTLNNGSKDEYSGDWINGRRDGHGTQTYLNGDVYTGYWKEDGRHGHGEITYFGDKSVYTGEWKFDLKHGMGKMKFMSGKLLTGSWRSDKFPWQQCSLRMNNGDEYCGMFGWGFRTGGCYEVRYANGDLFVGQFATNQDELYTGHENTLADDWFDKATHRKGKMVFSNGEVLNGLWSKNVAKCMDM
jgi:hypothetical protein